MKAYSPLFAVAFASALSLSSVNAACTAICTVDSDADCMVNVEIPVNTPLTIVAPAEPACAYAKYLDLKLSAASSDTIEVTFSDALTSTPTDEADATDGSIVCSSTYSAVGKDIAALTKSVEATVTCMNAADVPCTITYLATHTCQRDPALCATECDGAACEATDIAADGGELALTNAAACPGGFNYLKSFTVGARDKTNLVVAFTGVDSQPTADPKVDSCYFQYGQTPADLTALTANVAATVTCADTTNMCTVQTYHEWGCSAPLCDRTCEVGCTEAIIPAEGIVLMKPMGTTCANGAFAYPKGLVVGGKYAADKVVVTFNELTPMTTDEVGQCYYTFDDIASEQQAATVDVEVTIECADNSAPCTAQYKVASWECYTPPVQECATQCTDAACKSTDIAADGGELVLTNDAACPGGFNYFKSLKVGAKDKTNVAVEFIGIGAQPTADPKVDSCYFQYGQTPTNPSALGMNMEAKVTCVDTTKACTVQTYPEWGCDARLCDMACTTGCTEEIIPIGGSIVLTKPVDATTCANGAFAYPRGLVVGGKYAADSVVVAFNELAPVANAKSEACYYFYDDIASEQLAATMDVVVTIKCEATGAECTAQYKVASWECYTPPVPECSAQCTDAACLSTDIAADGGELVLTNDAACPGGFNYFKSLTVGARDKTDVKVVFTGVESPPTADSEVHACYFQYGPTPVDPGLRTANVAATVTCMDPAKACTVQTYHEWGCDAPLCGLTCTGGCTEKIIPTEGSVVLTKPMGTTCANGAFAYPKGLVVGGKYAADKVVVTFNELTPAATAERDTCYYTFEDVVGMSAAVTKDVEVTIKCFDKTAPCTVQHKVASWECYASPDAAKPYSRTAAVGAGCPEDASCAGRCAKSYNLGMKDGSVTFVSALTPTGCPSCATLTATGDLTGATNVAASMDVTFDDVEETMTIDVTTVGAECTSTYTQMAFSNPFQLTTYTRTSVSPAVDCEEPDDCAYECAAEVTLTTSEADTIRAVPADVPGCNCTEITAFVNGDNMTASGNGDGVAYLLAVTDTGVALNTTIEATTCYAVYTEKESETEAPETTTETPVTPETTTETPVTPETTTETPATTTTTPASTTETPAPTTAKTGAGTSAGVSALGGGAGVGVCTVTLAAAAAGVQVMGMPL